MIADHDRVKYYGPDNLGAGRDMLRVEEILNTYAEEYETTDVNDIIELDNVRKYIEKGYTMKVWTTDDIANIKIKLESFKSRIVRFFNSITDDNIQDHYESLNDQYVTDFWEIMTRYSRYKSISKDIIKKMIESNVIDLHDFLQFEKLVSRFGNEIKESFVVDKNAATMLLNAFVVQHDTYTMPKLFFPEQLSLDDKETILNQYLDREDANLNYVRLIENLKNSDNLRVNDETRLKAKRLAKKLNDDALKDSVVIKNQLSVSFVKNQAKPVQSSNQDNCYALSYSLSYVLSQKNSFDLFQNFIHLFKYVDELGRINLLSHLNKADVLETLFFRSRLDYFLSREAITLNELALMQLYAFEAILKKYFKISLEDLITSYLQQLSTVFKIEGLVINMPRKELTSFEKIRLIVPEIDVFLKRYDQFVRKGEIDEELVKISSSPLLFNRISSKLPNKYIYLNEECEEAMNVISLLCSNQTLLGHVQRFKNKSYHRFINLMISEPDVYYSDFEKFQQEKIDYLISTGFLVNDHDKLIFADDQAALLLYDLYMNDVNSHYHFIDLEETLKWLESKNYIKYGGGLLSQPEVHYLNWILNSKEFSNSLDLRNKYMHGSQGDVSNENEHEKVYHIMLLVLILLMLKIQDDLIWGSNKDRS